MSRNYKLTPSTYGFKVEMWDEYGYKRTIYERTVELATERIYDFWEETEERNERNKIHNECMVKMFNKNK